MAVMCGKMMVRAVLKLKECHCLTDDEPILCSTCLKNFQLLKFASKRMLILTRPELESYELEDLQFISIAENPIKVEVIFATSNPGQHASACIQKSGFSHYINYRPPSKY